MDNEKAFLGPSQVCASFCVSHICGSRKYVQRGLRWSSCQSYALFDNSGIWFSWSYTLRLLYRSRRGVHGPRETSHNRSWLVGGKRSFKQEATILGSKWIWPAKQWERTWYSASSVVWMSIWLGEDEAFTANQRRWRKFLGRKCLRNSRKFDSMTVKRVHNSTRL